MQISEMISWIGSVLAVAAFLQRVIPSEYWEYIADQLLPLVSPYTFYVIPEYEGSTNNELYGAVQAYLSSLTRQRAHKSTLLMQKNAKNITFSLAKHQRIRDTFQKVKVEWVHDAQERKNTVWCMNETGTESDERRSFQVKMPRQHKDFLLDTYFTFIMQRAKELERSNRDLNLYSNKKFDPSGRKGGWNSIPFKHPASFDTIALDPEQKMSILNDLHSFIHGEEFYKRVGKAWKRGYLLFGPPGTGKTSVIAAMANELRYDVYDLELTEVQTNADLRKLLLHTSSKSIIVIEDIDCSLDLAAQRHKEKTTEIKKATTLPTGAQSEEDDKPRKVTLSGLLNFTDGLWSCCGSERIFIFTTNYVKKLDPALLRPGRMDMHIDLSYCRYPAFKILARNFLQIIEHPRFTDVQKIIDSSFMTPAEIAEILTKDRNDPDFALDLIVKALHDRKSKPPSHEQQGDTAEPDESEDLLSKEKTAINPQERINKETSGLQPL